MKFLIFLIFLFPSIALAVEYATVIAIDSKASSANSKVDGNNSHIQALEAEDIILHNQIDTIELTSDVKSNTDLTGLYSEQGI